MKTFTTALLALSVVIGTADAATNIVCKSKYLGTLKFNSRAVTYDGGDRLAYADSSDSGLTTFHFDNCQTDGWNVDDGREFGQFKATPLGDYVCLTAGTDERHTLTFQKCASSNEDELLQRQWWSANYNGARSVATLALFGNPNRGDTTYQLPNIVDAGQTRMSETFEAAPADANYRMSFSLHDITVQA